MDFNHVCISIFQKHVLPNMMLKNCDIIVEMPVPVAIIVCEGDFKTIGHISRALKYNLPVIIMKGSGMTADLVSERLEKYVS